MPIEFDTSSLEARVLKLLQEAYPLTTDEMMRKLRISESRLKRVLATLQSNGLVALRPLPDKTYVDLISQNFRFSGRNPSQKKKLKHSKRPKKKTEDYDGPMYG
ncbi:MAG: transcriptional regulator [Thermoplasmata archaeon]|nr:transcriptional regulator [Thermoplasmata archaeon]